jgi:8-oxo-dGTP pyrophosphatase MutT (NUDIX family)
MPEEVHEDKLARWAKDGRAGKPAVEAATVILLRDGSGGLETLMLRKNSKIAFGGMWVFPGGRVDEADRSGLAPEDDFGAARRAAVREAQEETELVVTPDSMVAYSHWTPPPITPKRFLTWFFAAAAPSGEVVIDDGEIKEHDWMQPGQALERRDAGDIELAPPTFVTLFELARCGDLAAALTMAGDRTPERFQTQIVVTDDGPVALWHGDAGYEAKLHDAPGARHRLSMRRGGWRYERS